MADQSYLAIDLGAESGRGLLARFDGNRFQLETLGRFPTSGGDADLCGDGIRRWDIQRIWNEIRQLVDLAASKDSALGGVGVDSWGVDYGLVDADGALVLPPVQYRDATHAIAREEVLTLISEDELWRESGLRNLPFNTLFQLYARKKENPALLDQAAHLLMIPDLMHHWLTGSTSHVVEWTNASNSQLIDIRTRDWNRPLLDRLGIPHHFLGEIAQAGARVGTTPGGVPVYAPATHDTGSAVAAAPAEAGSRWAFLSSGTWSLFGMELPAPATSEQARRMALSNEGGVRGTTRLLKNIMGLWLVQECRRGLIRAEGREYSYAELTALAAQERAGGPRIDAVDERFLAPADMIGEIRAACVESGQRAPETVGALIRCCLDSLALAYRRTLHDMEAALGVKCDVLHIVGGGCQNELLSQLAANACGIPVVAGPVEATAIGNVLAQMIGAGTVSDWDEARRLSRQSFPTTTYTPDPTATDRWDEG